MYVITLDWAEILRVLLPLFTLLAGSYATYKIQKQKLNREDQTRFHTHRLERYSELMQSMTKMITLWQGRKLKASTYANDALLAETLDRVGYGLAIVTLIGSEDTQKVASELTKVHRAILGEIVANGKISEELRIEFTGTQGRLTAHMRKELEA